MIKKITFVSIVFSIFFFGCQSKKETFKYLKSYSFQVPYNIHSINTNTDDNNAFFQTYSTNAHTRIDNVGFDGNIISTKNLQAITSKYKEIYKIIPHADKFYLFTRYNNQLIVLNQNCEEIKSFQFAFNYKNSTEIELIPAMLGSSIIDPNTILMSATYYFSEDMPSLETYVLNRIYPHFVKIDISDTSAPKATFLLENFYSRFLKDGFQFTDFGFFQIQKDKIVLNNLATDSIYLADINSGKITKSLHLKSKNSTLKLNQIPLNEGMQNRLNESLKTNGYVLITQYDKYRKKNYVYIQYKNEVEISSNEPKPWGILVYDENFKFVQEIKIDNTKYDPSGIIIVKDGILLRKFLKDRIYHNEFDFFQI